MEDTFKEFKQELLEDILIKTTSQNLIGLKFQCIGLKKMFGKDVSDRQIELAKTLIQDPLSKWRDAEMIFKVT